MTILFALPWFKMPILFLFCKAVFKNRCLFRVEACCSPFPESTDIIKVAKKRPPRPKNCPNTLGRGGHVSIRQSGIPFHRHQPVFLENTISVAIISYKFSNSFSRRVTKSSSWSMTAWKVAGCVRSTPAFLSCSIG